MECWDPGLSEALAWILRHNLREEAWETWEAIHWQRGCRSVEVPGCLHEEVREMGLR